MVKGVFQQVCVSGGESWCVRVSSNKIVCHMKRVGG